MEHSRRMLFVVVVTGCKAPDQMSLFLPSTVCRSYSRDNHVESVSQRWEAFAVVECLVSWKWAVRFEGGWW